jgi:hypothetical protein
MFFYNETDDNSLPSPPPGGDDPTTPIVGWTRTTIYDPNITTNINFGDSVDATSTGEYIVVGAPNHRVDGDNKQGRAYVFKRGLNNSWDTNFELVPSDRHPSGFDYFGTTVAISGDGNVVVVGAKKTFESPDGAAYVFEKTAEMQWTQIDKLKIPAGEHNATTTSNNIGFAENGVSVSHDGNIIVIGAPSNFGVGRVHTWHRTGAGQAYSHSSFVRGAGDYGKSVQISPNGLNLIVGVPLSDSDANYGIYSEMSNTVTDAGNIDYLNWNAGTNQWEGYDDTYYNSWQYDYPQNLNNYYGTSVAISDVSLVASAIGFDGTTANEVGKVLIQNLPVSAQDPEIGSTHETTLTLPENYMFENDFFGHVVDVSQDGNFVFVSANGKSSSDLSSFGAVYAFEKNTTTGEWDNIGAFLSDNPAANAQFGNAMRASRDGNVVAVGESLNSVQTSQAGALHIFLKDS